MIVRSLFVDVLQVHEPYTIKMVIIMLVLMFCYNKMEIKWNFWGAQMLCTSNESKFILIWEVYIRWKWETRIEKQMSVFSDFIMFYVCMRLVEWRVEF